jgi:hypothetical protein
MIGILSSKWLMERLRTMTVDFLFGDMAEEGKPYVDKPTTIPQHAWGRYWLLHVQGSPRRVDKRRSGMNSILPPNLQVLFLGRAA